MITHSGDKIPKAPQITAYPSYGFMSGDGDWLVNFSGITYQTPPFNLRQRMLIKMLANMMKASSHDLQTENFQDRIWPFFVEASRGQRMMIEIGGKSIRLTKKSRRNGHFDNWLRLSDQVVNACARQIENGSLVLDFRIFNTNSPEEAVDCSVKLLKPNGLSIVSDIDDTIKDSNVSNRRELLVNTFIRDFRSVEGMSAVYQAWCAAGADFHYVSSSPWQLYPSLNQMRSEFEFPSGPMHLRNFRLRDQLLTKLLLRRKGKATEICRLVRNLPHRKFILVGDSGEKDPEIYQKICRKFPDQIKGVFIRNVRGREMDRDRVEKMRRSVGRNVCGTFANSEELLGQARPLLQEHSPGLVNRQHSVSANNPF